MKIFDAKTFGEFLSGYLKTLPNKGRGELRKISTVTRIHSTTLSQAMKGGRPFSLEQVASICEYLGLNRHELRYALLLLQAERAGTETLKNIFLEELKELKQEAYDLVHVVSQDRLLSDAEKAIFYSNWYYSAIAVLCSISGFQDISSLGSRVGLSKQKTNQVIDFLTKSGICIEKNGKLLPGANSTHLEASSPLIGRHHGNWRIKAMDRHPNLDLASEISYSSPMSISTIDSEVIRNLIVDLVRKVSKIRDPSACQEGYFLNIDWIKI